MFSEGQIDKPEADLREQIATAVQARLGGLEITRSAPRSFTLDEGGHSGALQGPPHLRAEEWHWELQHGLFAFHLAATEALGWLECSRVPPCDRTHLDLFQRYWELALVSRAMPFASECPGF